MSTNVQHDHLRIRVLSAAMLAAFPAFADAGVAGRFQFVAGDVRVVGLDSKERPAQKGQDVSEGEILLSGPGASAQVKMVDGGTIALRPDTRLKLDAYAYNGADDGNAKAFISLLKGGFRAITGLIGKTRKENYSITTSTATIGIRGTDHEPVVILPPPPGVEPTHPPGTYDKVNRGATSLTTLAGTTVIARNQVGFAAAPNQPPVILPKVPDFYQATSAPPTGPEKRQDAAAKQDGKSASTGPGSPTSTSAAADSDTGSASGPAASTTSASAPASSPSDDSPRLTTRTDSTPAATVNRTELAATVVTVTPPASTLLSGTDARGGTLNTATQTLTTAAGVTEPIASPVVTPPAVTPPTGTAAPAPSLLLAYPVNPTVDATTLAGIDTQIQSTQTALSAAQTQRAAGGSAATAAQAALSAAQTAAAAGGAAYDAMIAGGVPATDPLATRVLNAVTAAKQAVQLGFNAYDGSGTGSAGSAGASKTLAFADQALQAANRLVASAQTQIATNTASAVQDVGFSLQAVSALFGQFFATAGSFAPGAASAANGALAAAVSAQSTAQAAAAALAAIATTDPNFSRLKAASDAATAAANAAKSAADAAVAVANAATVINQGIQTLLSRGTAITNQFGAFFAYANNRALSGSPLSVSKNASGQVIGANFSNTNAGINSFRETYATTGGTLVDPGQDAATGLAWGRWQGGQVVSTFSGFGQDATGQKGLGAFDRALNAFVIGSADQNTTNLGPASFHWITGQEAFPGYLAQVLTGTATYAFVGGTHPTDTLGNVGILNKTTLAANFTAQTVDAGVDFTIGGNHWVLQGNGLPLNGGRQFFAFSCVGCGTTSGANSMATFSKNGSPVQPVTANVLAGTGTVPTSFTPFANLRGELLGTGLSSAGLEYAVTDYVPTTKIDSITGQAITTVGANIIQGVAGFSGPTQNTATPYRLVGIEDGSGSSVAAGANPGEGTTALGSGDVVNPLGFTGAIKPAAAAAGRVVDSPAGLTEFIGAANYQPIATAPSFNSASAATIRIGTAVNKDVGSTTIDGLPISWGRWEGGSVDIYTLDGGSKLGTIANANKSIHWIASGVLTGPASGSLPLTGTASYTLVGNTNPTDFKGNVGTLGAATLSADFGRMLVNASVTANFNAATNTGSWSTTASNVPIGAKGGFESSSAVSGAGGVVHTASCTGSACGSQTQGAISGTFIGTAAAGAVLSYRMATGSTTTPTTTVAATSPGIPANFVPTAGVVGLAVFRK